MDSDVIALFEQRLMELRGLMNAISGNIKQHEAEMPPGMAEVWSGTWGALHDEINAVSCYHCEEGVATVFSLDGPRCAGCAEKVAA
jgi:hypothetical protein